MCQPAVLSIPQVHHTNLVSCAPRVWLGPGVVGDILPSLSLGHMFCWIRSQFSQASGFPCWYMLEISRTRNTFVLLSIFGARSLRKSLSGHYLTTDNRTETSVTTHKEYTLCENSLKKLQIDNSSPNKEKWAMHEEWENLTSKVSTLKHSNSLKKKFQSLQRNEKIWPILVKKRIW